MSRTFQVHSEGQINGAIRLPKYKFLYVFGTKFLLIYGSLKHERTTF